jgi:hypothetical protein
LQFLALDFGDIGSQSVGDPHTAEEQSRMTFIVEVRGQLPSRTIVHGWGEAVGEAYEIAVQLHDSGMKPQPIAVLDCAAAGNVECSSWTSAELVAIGRKELP